MVKTTTPCDLSDSPNATLVEDDTSASKDDPSLKTTATFQFWEDVIKSRKASQDNTADGEFVTSHIVPVAATTEAVPHFSIHRQNECSESEKGPFSDSKKVQLGIKYELLLLDQPESSSVGTSCDQTAQLQCPPFSQLLAAAVAHVDRTRQPLVFEGPTLQIIVQHKWETSCRAIFMLMLQAYAVFLGVFVITTLLFETLLDSDSDVQHAAAWSMWGSCFVYSLLLLKREFHQVRAAMPSMLVRITMLHIGCLTTLSGHQIADEVASNSTVKSAMRAHFEFWNIVDLLVALLTATSLIMMAAATSGDAVDIDLLRCFQATAGLLGGIKLLSFLRGLDFSAFLISMLEAIVADMANFFAVLLIITVSCVHAAFLRFVSPNVCVTGLPGINADVLCGCVVWCLLGALQFCIRVLLAAPGLSAGLPDHLQLYHDAGTSLRAAVSMRCNWGRILTF
jgi:hypothetical protein